MLKQSLIEASKRLEDTNDDLNNKIGEQSARIKSLETALTEQLDIVANSTEREHRYRQEISRMSH
jgi:hypothetical protein